MKFLGAVDYRTIPYYYELCDLFVHPGKVPWGLIINDVMIAGKPIITSNLVGASYDLITKGENGFIYRYSDVKGLSKALKIILTNNLLRKKMGQKSKEKISSFTYDQMSKAFITFINQIS